MKPHNSAEWIVFIFGLLGFVICLHNHDDFNTLFVLMLLIVPIATAEILERSDE